MCVIKTRPINAVTVQAAPCSCCGTQMFNWQHATEQAHGEKSLLVFWKSQSLVTGVRSDYKAETRSVEIVWLFSVGKPWTRSYLMLWKLTPKRISQTALHQGTFPYGTIVIEFTPLCWQLNAWRRASLENILKFAFLYQRVYYWQNQVFHLLTTCPRLLIFLISCFLSLICRILNRVWRLATVCYGWQTFSCAFH